MIIIKKAYMKVWKIDKQEKYTRANATTSEKVEDLGYKNSNWSLMLVGKSREVDIKEGDRIEIKSAKIENIWDKENKKNWLNVIVFDFVNLTQQEDMDDVPF